MSERDIQVFPCKGPENKLKEPVSASISMNSFGWIYVGCPFLSTVNLKQKGTSISVCDPDKALGGRVINVHEKKLWDEASSQHGLVKCIHAHPR